MAGEAKDNSILRRTFLRRVLRSAVATLGIGAVGLTFWDRQGPAQPDQKVTNQPLPDFRLTEQTGKLAVARGPERKQSIVRAMAALGGMHAFIKPGDRVLLKVNAAFAASPMLGATTHPDLVMQVIQMCRQAGATRVSVTDNPINDPASCFTLSGISHAAHAAGAQVILPRSELFEPYTLESGTLIRSWPVLCGPLRQADKVIGMAPLKNHHRSGASMSIKNWYGLLGGRRNIFHQQIHSIIKELALMIKPTLVILDGTTSMITNGPTGGSLDDLKATHVMIAGTDPVAVDAFGATILGKTVRDLPHLKMAEKAGAGTVDFQSLNPVYLNNA